VKDVGRAGDVVEVANGYARNYLYPRKLAIQATPGNLQALERRMRRQQQSLERAHDEALALKERIDQLSVTIKAKTGSGTKLSGSVTAQDVADALAEEHGISLDKRDIHMEEHIKSTGSYSIPIKLHTDVTANLQLEVIGEGEEGAG